MGLFSSKKKTYVSSSVWNMAGDIKDRANYLKSVVVGNIIMDSPTPLGQAIPNAYINGPGMGLRRYAKWARGSSNYDDDVGFVGGGILMGDSMDPVALQAEIPHGPNEFVVLGENDLGWADYTWWAEEYMVNNHQDLLFTNWTSEIADVTNEITIIFEDTTTEVFSPVDYDPTKKYMYALYQTVSGGITGPTVPGVDTPVPDEASFPPVPPDYVLYSDVDSLVPAVLDVHTVVDVTYSDATPPTHDEYDSTIGINIPKNVKTYHKYTMVDSTNSTRDIYEQTRTYEIIPDPSPEVTVVDEDIGGGVIKTTTTTVTQEQLSPIFSYRNDVQTVVNDFVSLYKYFRYKEGDGNATLDAMFALPADTGAFLPYIPIRINNNFLRDTDPEIYKRTRSAYKKAMAGADLNKLVRKVEDNDQLGDLDFVYAVYGTSLNSPEDTAREYMYRFFDKMIATNPTIGGAFSSWLDQWALADASMDAYIEWLEEKNSSADGYAGAPPTIIPYPSEPSLQIDISSTTSWMNFHMNIAFNGADADSGFGTFPGHFRGDYWLELGPTTTLVKRYARINGGSGGGGGSNSGGNGGGGSSGAVTITEEEVNIESLYLYYQDTDDHWLRITVYGLVHTNYVYDNKTVTIKVSEAMADPEESGFIIPLHEETFRDMRLVDQTQLATACCYLVFNCYVVKKSKWYQSGFFKLLLIVVIVVISIVFAPAGAGAAGVLGSSATVGAAIGFTGTAAIVAGTIANAIAAMIITKALSAALGDTLGGVIGAAVVVALTAYGGVMGGGNFDMASFTSELSKADNIMAITDGLVKSVNSYMQEKVQGIYEETQRLMQQYKADMAAVAKQYEEMFGGTQGVIDPLMFTSSIQAVSGENRQQYLERTLMCGSEVAQMSQDLIHNFAAITINTDLPS